jgi:molybdopterin biosynthesis enzyme
MEQFETEQSVGRMICHDITKIEKGVFKGALFKKGHIIQPEDVQTLLNLGKKNIFVLELEPGELHEDEAGESIARALAGPGLDISGPAEGRLNLAAKHQGLLKIDASRLLAINSIPDVVVSTLHNNSPVKAGERVAGAKVIPLVVKESTVRSVEEICSADHPLMQVIPYQPCKIGGLITGREVFEGRIKDGFAPVLAEKAANFNLAEPLIRFCTDDSDLIANAIDEMIAEGCSMIIITGGMSVDPDDLTPTGIKKTGAAIIKYGAPALPGAMFLLAYKDDLPLIGLPACAMYFKNTVLDIILPRLLAGQKVSAADIAALGHGGLCRQCEPCVFPNCSFGKGGL